MKLATTIPPRRDGTVIARGATGEAHVFRRGDSGDLECDVTDLDLVASLLSGGLFYPVDPADYDDALRLSGDVGADADGDSDADADADGDSDADADGDGDSDADADGDGDGEDDVGGGQPIEAETPPKPRRGRPPKAAKAAE